MAKRMKTLLLSGLSIALCMLLMVLGTFALFTDTASVTNHLVAGKLDATLERIALKTTKLDDKGYLATVEEQTTDDEAVDFSDDNAKNVFGLDENEVIVPCTVLEATMKLSNASDVAFSYWIEIVVHEEANDLTRQLKVTVTPEGGEARSQYLSEGVTLGSDGTPIGVLAIGTAKTFTVKVEFEDLETKPADQSDNDDAQGLSTQLDMIVHATQVTSEQSA